MIYAMSDIHGCINELKKNMQFVDLSGDKYYQIEDGKKKESFKGGVSERSIQ